MLLAGWYFVLEGVLRFRRAYEYSADTNRENGAYASAGQYFEQTQAGAIQQWIRGYPRHMFQTALWAWDWAELHRPECGFVGMVE